MFGRSPASITEFHDLLHGYAAECLAKGPDGALWVTDSIDQDFGSSVVARIATNGVRTAAYGYNPLTFPNGTDIVTGPDGALWFIDVGDGYIVRTTTSGLMRKYFVPNRSVAYAIAAGPDRALWFVEVRPQLGA